MTYGFTCGYCREDLDTPYSDADAAERYAHELGWRMTLGESRYFEGTAHVTCPRCVPVHFDPSPLYYGTGADGEQGVEASTFARELAEGVVLHTKDGRKIGNAVILERTQHDEPGVSTCAGRTSATRCASPRGRSATGSTSARSRISPSVSRINAGC